MFIFEAVFLLGILGALSGVLLAFASKIFYVHVDERIMKIRELLPGANCGACGFPGCDGMASAIVDKKAKANGCPVAKSDIKNKIEEIMAQAK